MILRNNYLVLSFKRVFDKEILEKKCEDTTPLKI